MTDKNTNKNSLQLIFSFCFCARDRRTQIYDMNTFLRITDITERPHSMAILNNRKNNRKIQLKKSKRVQLRQVKNISQSKE